jgi:prepilin-type N-terminal cleavage/methylation domain-containing protein
VRNQRGYSLLELLVVISLVGVIMGTATIAMKDFSNRAGNGAAELVAFLKRSRSKAMVSTLAYTVTPVSSSVIKTTYGASCTAAQTDDTSMRLTLPSGAALTNTSWSVCYSTRGLANQSYDLVVSDQNGSKTVRIVMGGGVKVL